MKKGQIALIIIFLVLAVAGVCIWQFWTPISTWFTELFKKTPETVAMIKWY